jgi:hypothetical protein
MQGWPIVTAIVVLEAAAASVAVGYAVRRRWDYLIILGAAILLLEPVAGILGSDVSRYLPSEAFSPGEDGKNQIALTSALTALFSTPVLAAAGLWVFRWLARATGLSSSQPR